MHGTKYVDRGNNNIATLYNVVTSKVKYQYMYTSEVDSMHLRAHTRYNVYVLFIHRTQQSIFLILPSPRA